MTDVTEAEMNRFLKIAPSVAAKRGRSLTSSGLLVVKAVMSNVISFANAPNNTGELAISWDRNEYEELSPGEQDLKIQNFGVRRILMPYSKYSMGMII